jgi:hypothetical protein
MSRNVDHLGLRTLMVVCVVALFVGGAGAMHDKV